jgi:signal transduction histidine kinase
VKERVADHVLQEGILPLESGLKQAVQELRQVVNELRPPNLDDLGLAQAIREHARELHKKFSALDLVIDLDEEAGALPDETNLALYRICQEALQNVVRHSQATRVVVRLSREDDRVLLSIKDNGLGFALPKDFAELTANQHYGLTGMKERIEAVGGTLQISSAPGDGTEVKASIVHPRV